MRRKARYVDPLKCTGCALCTKVDVPDVRSLVEHDGELWVDRVIIDEVKMRPMRRLCTRLRKGESKRTRDEQHP